MTAIPTTPQGRGPSPVEPDDYRSRFRRETEERRREITAKVLAAIPQTIAPEIVTTTTEFALATPIEVKDMYGGAGRLMVTRVVVKVSRYPSGSHEDDGSGFIEVMLFGRPVTKAGKVSKRAHETWMAGPEALAAPLLLAGMLRTGVRPQGD